MMNMGEELQRLHDLIMDLEKQNKTLKQQLDDLHRTYGCSIKPGTTMVADTEGCEIK